MKKLKVIGVGYSCDDEEYYEIGVVNMFDYSAPPIVAFTVKNGYYIRLYICYVKNGKREFLTKHFPPEVLEYMKKNNIEFTLNEAMENEII